jgi:SAM-dependent methyltransferase
MDREDHRALIVEALRGAGTVWADLGSGAGVFTLALAGLLPPGSTIYSVDRDSRALAEQEEAVAAQAPGAAVRMVRADLRTVEGLPPLDGVLAANSLHYVRDLLAAVTHIASLLRPGGRVVVVEYDIGTPSPWVPFPLPFERWSATAARAGLRGTRRLATRPSRFWRSVYSAMSETAAPGPGGP